jgi:hypothetical protein
MEQKNNDEIDLGYLFNKMSSGFRNLVRLFFGAIAFFLKYKYIIAILFIGGFILGYFADKYGEEVYNNELIVIPNFESTQYLYDKVEALSAKLKDNDTLFLKKIIGPYYKDLKELEAEPIVDVFTFITGNPNRVDLFKAITTKQDVSDYVEDPQNFQYYKYHHIDIKIKGKEHSNEIINGIVEYFNESAHFNEYMEVGRMNTKFRIAASELTISQIDTILKTTSRIQNSNGSLPSVLVSDNSQLNDLIESKGSLAYSLLRLNMQKIDEQYIIKVASANYDISEDSVFNLGNKVKYPILLILLFSGFFFLRHLYGKMKQIAEEDMK